jgi:anti-anti-sigma factor
MAMPTSVEGLEPGDHACLTFSDAEERLDIVAAFVRDGLADGQRVICFTDAMQPRALSAELSARGVAAEEPMRSGQLSVQGSDDAWLAEGAFSAEKMIDILVEERDHARRDGYSGLRVSADMAWATRPLARVEQLPAFEAAVNALFTDGRLIGICQYDRERFDAVTLAAMAEAHPKAVAATIYHEDPILRVCRQHVPPGLRVAGEIDYTRAEALSRALSEAIHMHPHIYVNLLNLRFMDASTAAMTVQTAASLTDGRRMTVLCNELVGKVLRMVGAHEVAGLGLVVGHEPG